MRISFLLVLWVASCPITLSQLPAPSFYHLKRDYDLLSGWCTMPMEDRYGFIWFGSSSGGGLYRYDGYDLLSFRGDPNRKDETIVTDAVYTIYHAPDSNIYTGAYLGFTRLNLTTGAVKNFGNYFDSLATPKSGVIQAILLDTIHQTLWLGTRYGLKSMNVKTEKITLQRPPADMAQPTPENIFQIYQDSLHTEILWLLAYEGLFTYNINTQQFEHVQIPGTALNSKLTFGVKESNSTVMWLATKSELITRFHPPSKTWKNYPVKYQAAANENWNGLLPLNENEFWLCSDSTVGRLQLQNGLFESWRYRSEYPDGLLQGGIYSDLLNDRHGRLWVTSFGGVQYAKDAYLGKSTAVKDLKVRIVGVDIVPVFEKKKATLLYGQSLDLQKEQRDITLQYVLPNPLDKSKVKYQYKLVGYDSDWIQTDQRRIRYSQLSGGDYTFMVTGKEGDMADWLPMTELKIHIEKRISEYWLFWISIILIILTSAIFFYRYMILRARKQERLKSEFEQKLSEIQMQALRAQMNPHFLFNSLNSIKYYAISKNKDETAAYLSKFALLVRTILNNSKSHTISLKDELEALQLYIEIEHLRLEGKFDYTIDIDKSIHIRQAQIPPMILQPYVENAIWHGLMHKESKGRLIVQVKDLGKQIQCIIEDNGVGRERAKELNKSRIDKKESVGMQITGNRIEIINRIYGIDTQVQVIDLKDNDDRPAGTRVVILVPLIKDEEE